VISGCALEPDITQTTVFERSDEPLPNCVPDEGIGEAEAITIARDRVGPGWEILVSELGRKGDVMTGGDAHAWARALPDDLCLWRVFLVRGDRGVEVIIDPADGLVYGTLRFIVD
jgi:hypothetical protein